MTSEALSLRRIARDVRACAVSWEPGVMLIGNVRADEIVKLADAVLYREALRRQAKALAAQLEWHDAEALRLIGEAMTFYDPTCQAESWPTLERMAGFAHDYISTRAKLAAVHRAGAARIREAIP